MEKKRSVGVTRLGICLLLCVIPGCFAATIGAISGSQAKGTLEVAVEIIMRILFISSPFLFLITGIGLLKLKNWARILTLFLSPALAYVGVGFTGIILTFLIPDKIWTFIFSITVIVTFLSIIYYLTRPEVKEQFR